MCLFPLLVTSLALAENQKDLLKEALANVKPSTNQEKQDLEKGKCGNALSVKADQQITLYVFVSFSLPEETWLTLSKEVEKVGGVLVLRGLPENSFNRLAVKMHALRKQGVHVAVQIDPRLFTKFGVEKVPCFVTVDEEKFDKLSGNVSLAFALRKMETKSSQTLRKLL